MSAITKTSLPKTARGTLAEMISDLALSFGSTQGQKVFSLSSCVEDTPTLGSGPAPGRGSVTGLDLDSKDPTPKSLGMGLVPHICPDGPCHAIAFSILEDTVRRDTQHQRLASKLMTNLLVHAYGNRSKKESAERESNPLTAPKKIPVRYGAKDPLEFDRDEITTLLQAYLSAQPPLGDSTGDRSGQEVFQPWEQPGTMQTSLRLSVCEPYTRLVYHKNIQSEVQSHVRANNGDVDTRPRCKVYPVVVCRSIGTSMNPTLP